MIGQTVAHYTITQKLGAGGMGEVYLAQDTSLDRQVALKLLPPGFAADDDSKARFKQEAKAAAALRHPGIITVYELGEFEGRIYIAMEYVPGQTLEDIIKAERMPVERFTRLAEQIADALAVAHDAGIIHRDIKPSNILVDERDNIKILDFGLARRSGATRITQAGSTLGTLLYQSPEQARREDVDHRSDIFSVGAVLYEMLAGQAAFQGDYDAAIVYSIAHEDPAPLTELRDDIPEATAALISRALAKDQTVRYQSLHDLLNDLRSGAEPATISQISAVQTRARPTGLSKTPILVAVAAVAAVAALTFALKPWSLFTGGGEIEAVQNAMAIMYFDNLSDPSDGNRMGEMCSDLLITGLSDNPDIHILSSQRIYDILKKLGKEGQRQVDLETANTIAKEARARWMLVGKIIQTEPLLVTTQILDTYTGDLQASQRSAAEAGENIFDQFDRLASEVRQDLGLDVDSSARLAEMITDSPEAYRFYLEGVEHCQKFYKPQALDAFNLALQLDSTMAMAYFYIARHRLGGNRKEMMDRALLYSENLPESQRQYVQALYQYVNGNLQEAISILQEVIKRDPTDKDAYNDLAGIYLLIPNGIPDALAARKKVVELDPVNDHALNECAMNFLALREYDSAAAYAARVIELVPEQANPYDTYALTLLTQGRYREAAENFLKALSINPRLTYTHDVLARLYAYLDDQKMFDSCLALQMQLGTPNYRASARYDAATLSRYNGEFTQAIAILHEGIRNDSIEVEPAKDAMYSLMFMLKAWCYRELGMADSARAAAERARTEAKRFGPVTQIVTYSDLALTLADQGDVAAARNALSSADKLLENTNRSTPHAIYQTALAWVTFHEGALDSAITILLQAAEIDVEYYRPCVEFYLAQVYIERGQAQLAIPLLQNWTVRIENLNWQEPEMFVKAHYFLALAYQDLNKHDQAVEHYQKFLVRWGGSSDRPPLVADARARLAQLTSQ